MNTSLLPKEITQDCDTEENTASFDYYTGIKIAKELGLKQSTNTKEGNFMVCCGDVMFKVKPSDYPEVTRRIF
jgi:hypothetical protein